MKTSPEAVYVIIPCIKDLGMSWQEIKTTPRHELTGLLVAYSNYSLLHQFDGYSNEDISTMAKDRPELRGAYAKCLAFKASMEKKAGMQVKQQSFKELLG